MVDEYHSILTMLQESSGENLYAFTIPENRMLPRIVAEIRHWRGHPRGEFEPQTGSQKYCDKDFFKNRMDLLWEHFADTPKVDPSWRGDKPPAL
jgi:hypothetical protein